MPSLEALTLTGKSSKCSSRGSDGRTRTGRAIFALRSPLFSRLPVGRASFMKAFEVGLQYAIAIRARLETSSGCAESDIARGAQDWHLATERSWARKSEKTAPNGSSN